MKLIIIYLIIVITKNCDGSVKFLEASSKCILDNTKIQLICSVSIITESLPIAINFNINNTYNETFLVKTGTFKKNKKIYSNYFIIFFSKGELKNYRNRFGINNLESYLVPNQLIGGANLYLLSNLFRTDDNLIGFEFHSFSNYNNLRIEIKSVDLPGRWSWVDFYYERTHCAFYINVVKGYNKFLLPNPCRVFRNWFIAIINPPRIFYVDSTLTSDYYDYYFHARYYSYRYYRYFSRYIWIFGRVIFNPILQQEYFYTDLELKYLFLDSGSFTFNLISLNHSKIIQSRTLRINSCKIKLKFYCKQKKIEHFLVTMIYFFFLNKYTNNVH